LCELHFLFSHIFTYGSQQRTALFCLPKRRLCVTPPFLITPSLSRYNLARRCHSPMVARPLFFSLFIAIWHITSAEPQNPYIHQNLTSPLNFLSRFLYPFGQKRRSFFALFLPAFPVRGSPRMGYPPRRLGHVRLLIFNVTPTQACGFPLSPPSLGTPRPSCDPTEECCQSVFL